MIDRPAVIAEITAAFAAYEAALLANDVPALDAAFWDHRSTTRFGPLEESYGPAAIAEFRRRRSAEAGAKQVRRLIITAWGDDVGWVAVEFDRGPGTPIGRQTQVWVRTDAGWRVATAHVSLRR